MKGGAKVVVEPHRHEGVFIARGKEDALCTLNSAPGKASSSFLRCMHLVLMKIIMYPCFLQLRKFRKICLKPSPAVFGGS